MTFEFDPNKSKSNKIKHGIDFDEAKELWNDPYAIELPSLQELDEERFWFWGVSAANTIPLSSPTEDPPFGSSPYDDREKRR